MKPCLDLRVVVIHYIICKRDHLHAPALHIQHCSHRIVQSDIWSGTIKFNGIHIYCAAFRHLYMHSSPFVYRISPPIPILYLRKSIIYTKYRISIISWSDGCIRESWEPEGNIPCQTMCALYGAVEDIKARKANWWSIAH